jgi:hypothetical protein
MVAASQQLSQELSTLKVRQMEEMVAASQQLSQELFTVEVRRMEEMVAGQFHFHS